MICIHDALKTNIRYFHNPLDKKSLFSQPFLNLIYHIARCTPERFFPELLQNTSISRIVKADYFKTKKEAIFVSWAEIDCND